MPLSETVDRHTILDLLNAVAFRVADGAAPAALNTSAEQLLAELAEPATPLGSLFGVDRGTRARDLLARGRWQHAVALTDGRDKSFRWEAFADDNAIVCLAVDWEPLRVLLDQMRSQSLQFKEIVLNVLPRHIVDSLIGNKAVRPRAYRRTSVLFADVVGFSRISVQLDPVSLIRRLNEYFCLFDEEVARYQLVKVKTVGDCYLCVSGIPEMRDSHAVDLALAALGMLATVSQHGVASSRLADGIDLDNWSFRIGIHSGPCIAGVVGKNRHHFDLWGSTINIASHMEAASPPGAITVSAATHTMIEPFFDCAPAERVAVSNVGEVEPWVVKGLKREFAADATGLVPNRRLVEAYCQRWYPELSPVPSTVAEVLRRVAP